MSEVESRLMNDAINGDGSCSCSGKTKHNMVIEVLGKDLVILNGNRVMPCPSQRKVEPNISLAAIITWIHKPGHPQPNSTGCAICKDLGYVPEEEYENAVRKFKALEAIELILEPFDFETQRELRASMPWPEPIIKTV